MATEAEEDENSQCGFVIPSRADFEFRHADFGNLAKLVFPQNLQIVIAVKFMVKLKNLFRLKDDLGPCLQRWAVPIIT